MMRSLVVGSIVLGLLVGSGGTSAAEEERAASGTFSPSASLAEGRNAHTSTLLPDGRVLVIGGGARKARGSAEVWDPASGTFGAAGTLDKPRKSHTATLLPDGRVLVIGGGRSRAEAELWDPATSDFEAAGRLAEGRSGHAAALLRDGRVLVVGGWKDPEWLTSAEIWDPATRSFSPTGSLARSRMSHTATALPDGRVLVVGGHGADTSADDRLPRRQAAEDETRALAEIWDPVTASFKPAGSLAVARSQHTTTALPDGRLLVVGGRGVDGDAASAEVWDPISASFSPAGTLAVERVNHAAAGLPDGRVLVVGGSDSRDRASAEMWYPTASFFAPAGSMAYGRSWHSATTLSDGRVLVVGGLGGRSSSSTEIWEPSPITEEVRDRLGTSARCNEPRSAFRRDHTTGDPESDREYLIDCVTCEELQALLSYRRVADLDMGLTVFEERACERPRPSPLQPGRFEPTSHLAQASLQIRILRPDHSSWDLTGSSR